MIGFIYFVNNWTGIMLNWYERLICYLQNYKLCVWGVFTLLDSSKKHHVWTQCHRQPTCYCLFVLFFLARSVQTLSHRSRVSLLSCYHTPDADSRSEAGGVFHPTPVFYFFNMVVVWQINQLHLFFIMSFFMYVFYCSDHCFLVINNVLFISAAFFFFDSLHFKSWL